MRTVLRKILIAVFSLGIVLTITGLALSDWNFNVIVDAFTNDEDYEYVEKNGDEEVKEIKIKINSGNIVFHIYDGTGYKVDFYESDYNKKIVNLENNVLTITNQIKLRYRFFNISFTPSEYQKLSIYLPESFNGKVNIETSSGNIIISNFHFTDLNIEVSSGNVILKEVVVENDTNIKNSSGNIELTDFSTNNLTIKASSGKILLQEANIRTKVDIKSSSGNIIVNTSKLSSIDVRTSSGNVHIIDSESDNIDLQLSSGNVKVILKGNVSDYRIDASVSSGNIYYQGKRIEGGLYTPTGSKAIKIRISSGNIELDFNEE